MWVWFVPKDLRGAGVVLSLAVWSLLELELNGPWIIGMQLSEQMSITGKGFHESSCNKSLIQTPELLSGFLFQVGFSSSHICSHHCDAIHH
jgi:hypothetical protein